MEIAYAYYKQQRTGTGTCGALDRFIKQYPNNPHLDYVLLPQRPHQFQRDINGLLGTLVQTGPVGTRPRPLRESFDAFKELVTRFPDSKYTPDARLRMQYLLNTLAASEIHVARLLPAPRRLCRCRKPRQRTCLIDYPQTPQTRDALQIMVQAYDAMGMKDLRDDTQRVLDLNIAKDGSSPTAKEIPAERAAMVEILELSREVLLRMRCTRRTAHCRRTIIASAMSAPSAPPSITRIPS